MDGLHSMSAENKSNYPASVDVEVSELQSKIGILEAENKLLKANHLLYSAVVVEESN